MRCIYYTRPENAERILAEGIDPSIPEHQRVATDTRYVELFPMPILSLTKLWRMFSWRYDQLRIRHWTPIAVQVPPDTRLALRHWGSQELWSQAHAAWHDANEGEWEYPNSARYEAVSLELRLVDLDEVLGWQYDNLQNAIPDYRIGARVAALSVRFALAQDHERDMQTIADYWRPQCEALALDDGERLQHAIGNLCVLMRGPIDKSLIAGIA